MILMDDSKSDREVKQKIGLNWEGGVEQSFRND